MDPIEIEARTLEEAVEMACERLGLNEEDIEVEVLSEGSAGIFGLVGAKNVRISAKPREDLDAGEEDEPEGEEDLDLARDAAEILENILSHFDLKTRVSHRMEGSAAYLDVSTENPGLLIGRKAQTLEAIQYIVGSMMSRRLARRVRVVVDVEGYRSRRRSGGKRKHHDAQPGQGPDPDNEE